MRYVRWWIKCTQRVSWERAWGVRFYNVFCCFHFHWPGAHWSLCVVTETQCGLVTEPVPTALTSVHLLGGPRVLNQSLRRCVVPSQQGDAGQDTGLSRHSPHTSSLCLSWPQRWYFSQLCVNLAFSCHLWRRFLPGWPSSWVLVNVQDETACWTQTLSYPRSPGSREHSCQMISGVIKFYPVVINYKPVSGLCSQDVCFIPFLSSRIFSFIDSLFQLGLANYIFCLYPCPFRQYWFCQQIHSKWLPHTVLKFIKTQQL